MKKILIILLFPLFICAQEEQLNEELIKKSIQWTKVASTGRDYKEAKKFLDDNFHSSTFSSNGSSLRLYDEEYFTTPVNYQWINFSTYDHFVQVSPNKSSAVVTFNVDGDYIYKNVKINYAARVSFFWTKVDKEWKKMHSHWSSRSGAEGIPINDR
jgi:hydroxymethylpyrimidine pyrophosphatase-like HAD family hydrolase|tara:strand:+ start:71 stop:538 length:468 start_codon:yes stop_codon:yes gene_type:complete